LHFSLSLCVLPSFLQMIPLFSMQFTGESNFRNWTFVLPRVNTCTSHSHTFGLTSSGFYHFSSTSRGTCTSWN
jgi:hypothetical protein